MFDGPGPGGPAGVGLDAALWIGTPAATQWRAEIAEPDITVTPRVQHGVLVTRSLQDWTTLPDDEQDQVRYLLLQNGDDPIPKFEPTLLWRRPTWLGPDATRPHGAPRGTRWLPVTTFFTTFVDLQNALAPRPGVFDEGGHDYRRIVPDTLRTVFSLTATPDPAGTGAAGAARQRTGLGGQTAVGRDAGDAAGRAGSSQGGDRRAGVDLDRRHGGRRRGSSGSSPPTPGSTDHGGLTAAVVPPRNAGGFTPHVLRPAVRKLR